MKKSNFIYLFVLLAGMVCLDACKKKEDPKPLPRKELLTSTSGKKWKITSATTTSGFDAFSSREACERDNLYVFYTDNKLVVDEGATKCNSSDPQTVTGTWSLSADEKTLTLSVGGWSILNGDFPIVEMTNTTLKGTFNFGGIPLNITLIAQ